uniref:Peptidase aspartic putative domain-containing protein n=1 Tax=Ditylenchus dipsaci TaxID=166011 RepID=A0A915D756_9BILA
MCRKITVFARDSQKRFEATLFVDGGSHGTLLKESFSQKAGFPIQSRDKVAVRPILVDAPIDLQSNMVEFGVQTKHGAMYLFGRTLPKLIPKTAIVPVEEKMSLASEYELIHEEPDILIGIDYYWDLEIQLQRRLSNGLCLADSILGPFISGRGSIPESNRGRPVHISANSLTIEEEEVELNAK